MSKTIEMIKNYEPFDEQEKADKEFFIECENLEQILKRENHRCHLCGSAFVVNKQHTKVLCAYHNIYRSWSWLGGHADGIDDMLFVAKKELTEESSLKNYKLLCKNPISIESLPVRAHMKRGVFVPAHCHLNVTYLFEADENEFISPKADENKKVAWLTFDELFKKSKEPYMLPSYKKIIKRLQEKLF